VVQSTPRVVEGEVQGVVKLEIFALRDVAIVAVVELAADEGENGEAAAEAREPVAQGGFWDHIPHSHGHTAGPFLEVAAGVEYGIVEEGYAVGHWCMPNVDEVEDEAVD
jgi:Xaa-Pro aminopeptidase